MGWIRDGNDKGRSESMKASSAFSIFQSRGSIVATLRLFSNLSPLSKEEETGWLVSSSRRFPGFRGFRGD